MSRIDAAMEKRIEFAADAAREAFFDKVFELFPEAVSGDFDPLFYHQFDAMCKRAARHWIECNVPGWSDDDEMEVERWTTR